MQAIHLNSNSIINLNDSELKQINGGTVESGYEAGKAVGAYIRNIIEGAGIVNFFYTLF